MTPPGQGIYKKCPYCGKRFYCMPSRIGKVYCSNNCQLKFEKINGRTGRIKQGIHKICKACGKKFYVFASRKMQEYCSAKCISYKKENNPNWKGGLVEITCVICGKVFKDKKYKGSYRKTCSLSCRFKYSAKILERRTTLECPNCKKKFIVKLHEKKERKFCSASCSTTYYMKQQLNTNPLLGLRKKFSAGKREDLGGLFVRSSWEANYARYLNWLMYIGEIKSWEYEPDDFEFPIRHGTTRYLPDFKITNNDNSIEYHEVKGYLTPKAKTQIARFHKYYPNLKLIIIDEDNYRAIAKQCKNLVPGWETKKG